MSNPIKVIKLSGISGSLDSKADVNHTHVPADIVGLGTAATSNTSAFATAAQGATADSAVQPSDIDTLTELNANFTDGTVLIDTNDPRLSDARDPLTHTHTLSDITDAGTAAGLDVPVTGDATASQVVKGDDSRLTGGAYAPASHTHTFGDLSGVAADVHTHSISDITDRGSASELDVAVSGDALAGQVVKGDDTRLTDDRNPLAHTHTLSDVTDAGTSAGLDVAATGNAAAGEVVKGDDTRLTDSRTPIAHTHTESQISDLGTNIILESDTDISAAGFVLNESDLVSNSSTKLATQSSIKTYVDDAVSTVMDYKGTYDGVQNIPNLDSSPAAGTISVGDTYTVSVPTTTFYGQLELFEGDSLIATQDDPSLLNHWAILRSGDAGTLTGNMVLAADYDASVAPVVGAAKGAVYVVTVAGDGNGFFATTLEIDDLIIARIDNASSNLDWLIIKQPYSTLTQFDEIGTAATTSGFVLVADGTDYSGRQLTASDLADAAAVTTGTAAPTTAPASEGDIFVDTTADEAYVAVGTASSADWQSLGAGGVPLVTGTAPPNVFPNTVLPSQDGEIFIDTVNNQAYIATDTASGYNGWQTIGSLSSQTTVANDTLWNTKGDIAAATGNDTAIRLGVGTNGQVLTANSATTTGLEWTTPASGGGGGTVQGAFQIYDIQAASANGIAPLGIAEYTVDLQTNRSQSSQTATGSYSTISGGANNTASNSSCVIGGGSNNSAVAYGATVSGGINNNISSTSSSYSVISGGYNNTISGYCADSTISGGYGHSITNSSVYAIIAGGKSNTVNNGRYSSILGGDSNQVNHTGVISYAAVVGGRLNTTAASYSSIIGGSGNSIDSAGSSAAIIASTNSSSTNYGSNAFLAATSSCTVSTYNTAIIASASSTTGGFMGGGYSAIIGGTSNSGYYASSCVILGGSANNINSSNWSVIGGRRCKLSGKNGVFAFADSTNADFTVDSADSAQFRVANGLHSTGPLFLSERASALTDIAGKGQLWVKTATPNQLWFTDDAGNDTALTGSTHGMLYENNNSTPEASTSVTPTIITWTTAGPASGTTADALNNYITLTENGLYEVEAHISCESGFTAEYEFEIYYFNGATWSGTGFKANRQIAQNGGFGSISLKAFHQNTAGNAGRYALYHKLDSGSTNTFLVKSGQFSVRKLA